MKSHGRVTFLRKRLLPKKSLARTSSWRAERRASARRKALNSPHKISGRRFAPPTKKSVNFLKVRYVCVFTVWLELILSKITERNQTKEASPATARSARHTTEKYSLLFSFCARRISFSPNEKSIFLWCLAFQVFRQVAGLASIFCKNTAEFPPHPPSAVFLRGRTGFLAATIFFSLPHHPCAEKVMELPLFTICNFWCSIEVIER